MAVTMTTDAAARFILFVGHALVTDGTFAPTAASLSPPSQASYVNCALIAYVKKLLWMAPG